jgi:hypothetical protein
MDPEPYIADARISAVVENLANPERFFMSGCAKLREKSWETASHSNAMPSLKLLLLKILTITLTP